MEEEDEIEDEGVALDDGVVEGLHEAAGIVPRAARGGPGAASSATSPALPGHPHVGYSIARHAKDWEMTWIAAATATTTQVRI